MAKVICKQYDNYTDRATGVVFRPEVQRRDGKAFWLGVAIVDDAVAREHFVTRSEVFDVEGLEDELSPDELEGKLEQINAVLDGEEVIANQDAVEASLDAPEAVGAVVEQSGADDEESPAAGEQAEKPRNSGKGRKG